MTKLFTPEEDAVLAPFIYEPATNGLVISLQARLPGRGIKSIRGRMWKLRNAAEAKLAADRIEWPPLGTRLFYSDPHAVADHGSPGRLGSAPLMHSGSGCSAGWAAA